MANVAQESENYICTTASIPKRAFINVIRHDAAAPVEIPVLQRRYCWEDAQLRRLVDDVVTHAGEPDGCANYAESLPVRPPDCGHSLGRIVVREAEGGVRPPLVIDGQQRLTSLLLLLASLRDVFRSLTRVENDSEQYRHDEQARGAANELVQKCNASLFPWGGQGSIPALDDLVGGSNQHQLLGKIVRSAALVPTYLDRDAYWEATHPESPLCGPDPGVPMDSTETLASGAELDGAIWGHDRIRSAKRTITAYLEDEALPKAISKTAVASAHWLGQSSLGCLVLAGKAILRSVLHSCYVLYFSVREEDVWSIYERLAFREAALRSLIDSKSPGVSMAECDLARNLLLSYFRIEEAQLEAFR
eukprot:CAMPEP_0177624302 /NCGR_PEP_ID=MMETSP0419_2-20121207/29415_1 /TAXON_ID=582737 /ORGANISM="Tetraselmis sp., Strain GSL018" /LENGTH=361 /DNA_ID=CAMNT_0019125015 /DNA_START=891 /DNA_END=1973 /DNA_ORIENTATION=+